MGKPKFLINGRIKGYQDDIYANHPSSVKNLAGHMQVNKSNKNGYPSEDISENVADDQNSQNLDILLAQTSNMHKGKVRLHSANIF